MTRNCRSRSQPSRLREAGAQIRSRFHPMRSTDGPRVSRQAASARACVDAHRSCEWEPPFNVNPERLGSKIASRKQASFQHVRSPTEIPAVRHVCARAPRRTGSRRRSRGLAVASLFRFPGHRSCNDVHDSIDPPRTQIWSSASPSSLSGLPFRHGGCLTLRRGWASLNLRHSERATRDTRSFGLARSRRHGGTSVTKFCHLALPQLERVQVASEPTLHCLSRSWTRNVRGTGCQSVVSSADVGRGSVTDRT